MTTNEKVLFVDDDVNLLASMERSLRRQFKLETANGGEAGLEKIAGSDPFAVVVSDRQMPGMDGVQFLSEVRKRSPDTTRVMLTGNVDLQQTVSAVNEGNIFRFLIKPCPVEILVQVVQDSIKQYRLVTVEKELLNKTLSGSIKLLTDILSMVDASSFGRAQMLRSYVTEVLEKMPLADLWETQMAAMLSPIGCVTLPPDILLKSRADGLLSKSEELLIHSAPGITARLLSNIPRLEGVARIARYQNTCFDGSGFPADGTHGTALPAGSRLLKILNDMLELHMNGASRLQALDQMSSRQGWYDLQLLAATLTCFGLVDDKPEEGNRVISVGIDDLVIGMTLASDVIARDGTLILSTGHYISQMILERIRNFASLYGIRGPIFVRAH
jgi:response regulator RpfG family c-di-GMP phosphodiesterase